MKRIYCLYRVSTKKQVDKQKDDIPMQKLACHEFAEKNGWSIKKEFYEKGISGFKVSANNRDAIQELKEAAIKKEFDVLLVYMFDRLGRRDDETPFVVEWFSNQGIEIWSVQEGQQKFINHTDKLLNYIRYWQANGESVTTSMRLKTRMAQLTAEGIYHGGVANFGYRAVYKGRVNIKGQPVRDLEIVPEEAEYVKMIFDKTVNEDYGSHRMAKHLNKMGVKTHNGSEFQSNTVNRILKNRLYCGYYVARETVSPKIEHLVIIDEDLFDKVQLILKQRGMKFDEKLDTAMQIKGKALLSDNIYCNHCGCHLVVTEGSDNYIRKDGTRKNTKYLRYICYHSARKLNDCNGPTVYSATKIDSMILETLSYCLHRMVDSHKDELVEMRYKQEMKNAKKLRKTLYNKKEQCEKRLKELVSEVVKGINGKSDFSADVVSSSFEATKNEIDNMDNQLIQCTDILKDRAKLLKELASKYNQLMEWVNEFDNCDFEGRKTIVCQLIKSVKVERGYKINIEFCEAYKQFLQD